MSKIFEYPPSVVYVYDHQNNVVRLSLWGNTKENFKKGLDPKTNTIPSYPASGFSKEHEGRDLVEDVDFKLSFPTGAKVKCLFKDSAHGFWINRGDVLTIKDRVMNVGTPDQLKFEEIPKGGWFYANDFELTEGFMIAVPLQAEVEKQVEWKEKFIYWLTNNQWINASKAQIIADHVEKYIKP